MSDTAKEAVRLAKLNTSPRDIAARLEIAVGTVSHYLWQARQRGEDVPRFYGTGRRYQGTYLALTYRTRQELNKAASIRNVGVAHLAQKIVECAMRDGLVDAILDDGVTSDG